MNIDMFNNFFKWGLEAEENVNIRFFLNPKISLSNI